MCEQERATILQLIGIVVALHVLVLDASYEPWSNSLPENLTAEPKWPSDQKVHRRLHLRPENMGSTRCDRFCL